MTKQTRWMTIAALSVFLLACGDKQSTTSGAPPIPELVMAPPTPDSTPALPDVTAAPAPAPAATTSTTGSAAAPAAGGVNSVSDRAMGKPVYDKACASCHDAGIAGAPKPSDRADWAPRVAQGKDTLYQHTIDGYTGSSGMHPARGGNATLTDEEVKASVDYLLGQAM